MQRLVIEQFELSQLAVGGSLKVLNFLDLVCIQLWEVFAAANGFVLAVAEARSAVIEIGAPLCAMSHSDTEAVRILCHTLKIADIMQGVICGHILKIALVCSLPVTQR